MMSTPPVGYHECLLDVYKRQVIQSRKTDSQDDVIISIGDHFTVGYFYIRKSISRKDHSGCHHKRCVNCLFLSVDLRVDVYKRQRE